MSVGVGIEGFWGFVVRFESLEWKSLMVTEALLFDVSFSYPDRATLSSTRERKVSGRHHHPLSELFVAFIPLI